MGKTLQIEDRTKRFAELHKKLSEENKMITHEELAKLFGLKRKQSITEILGLRQNIQQDQWEAFKKHFGVTEKSTEISVPRGNSEPDSVYSQRGNIVYIEVKTASGKSLQILPEGKGEIALLNAFLEERDRVITTLKDEKQARIDELKQDKENLLHLLNSSLGDISKVQQAIFAMVRTLQQHEAVMTSQGNKKREVEMLSTLSKLNGDNLSVDARQGNGVVLHK